MLPGVADWAGGFPELEVRYPGWFAGGVPSLLLVAWASRRCSLADSPPVLGPAAGGKQWWLDLVGPVMEPVYAVGPDWGKAVADRLAGGLAVAGTGSAWI
jgi:hypothetical protein